MQEMKTNLASWVRLILIVLLASLILAECVYLFLSILSFSYNFSLSDAKTFYFLCFIIILCIMILCYIFYHARTVKTHFIALHCSDKISKEEYEKMVRVMTKREVEKLKKSSQFKDYLMKKTLSQEKQRESDEELLSESEKNE